MKKFQTLVVVPVPVDELAKAVPPPNTSDAATPVTVTATSAVARLYIISPDL